MIEILFVSKIKYVISGRQYYLRVYISLRMGKDRRYNTVKLLIETGHITEFSTIFEHIPKSIVANDLGTNYNRLARLITHTEQFTLEELVTLSSFFEVDSKIIVHLALDQHIRKKVKRKT